MIQLKVYPDALKRQEDQLFLDLYETEPIKLNLSIEDITNADATSTFSRTFKVPATRHNSQFFENAYLVNGVTFDITVKKPAEILVDGAEFKVGHVRLQKIYINSDMDKTDYELLFLGETRDFSSIIAEKPLCQLTMTNFSWPDLPVDYTDASYFEGPYNYTQQTNSWEAFPESTLASNLAGTTGFAFGNILFPLIDHGNFYDDNGNPIGGTISVDGPDRFTQSSNALANVRLKPMVRVKRIWDQIFEDSGYTYESNFLNSERFYQMYLSAFGNNEQSGMEIEQTTTTNFQAEEINEYQYEGDWLTLNDSVYNPGGFFHVSGAGTGQGSWFDVPATASTSGPYYIMSASAEVDAWIENSDYTQQDVLMRIELWRTNPGVPLLIHAGNYSTNYQTTWFYWDSRNGGYQPQAGDELQIRVSASTPYDFNQVRNIFWNCTAAPGTYYLPQDLDCEYRQIDLIKDILTAFRLVMQPDIYRPNHFIIEPWQDFIGSGTTYDWSKKLIKDKDFVVEPLFNTQSATIEFSFLKDEDYINKFHEDNYKYPYGWLRFDSQNELLKGKRDVKLIGISPTPVDQIEHGTNAAHPIPNWIIPQVHKHETSDTALEHLPIKANSRLLFYNGLQDIGVAQDDWYLLNSGTPVSQDQWPLVSPYEAWPPTATSLNLNFYNDIRYYLDPNPGTGYFDQGPTLFDEYWSRYITTLYNKYSRRVTAYFTLDNVDLQNLTFDDVIFVNGIYYRPEKIIDAQVGEKTAVKCELITLLDQRVVWANEPLDFFSAVGVNPPCPGELGSINVSTCGTPNFTWTLDNGMSGTYAAAAGLCTGAGAGYFFTIPNVPPGTYTLTVTDSLGRIGTTVITITANESAPVNFTVSNIVQPTDCIAPCNGEVTVAPTGGTPSYTITWSDGVVQTGIGPFTRTDICPGEITWSIEDANGCESPVGFILFTCNEPIGTGHTWAPLFYDEECNPSLGVQWEYTSDAVSYAPNTIVRLTGRSGCWQLIGTPPQAPTTTVASVGGNCATCASSPVYNSWSVQEVDALCGPIGDILYTEPNGFSLQPGNIVKLNNEPTQCYIVLEESIEEASETVTSVYRECEDCINSISGYIWNAARCDGGGSVLVSSVLPASINGVYLTTAGYCVTILNEEIGIAETSLDESQIYENCTACQGGGTLSTCHEVVGTSAGLGGNVEFEYENAGLFWYKVIQPGDTINVCALAGSVNFLNGSNGIITNTGFICSSDGDCKVEIASTCHRLVGPGEYQWSFDNQFYILSLGSLEASIVCADVSSVTGPNWTDLGNPCQSDAEC